MTPPASQSSQPPYPHLPGGHRDKSHWPSWGSEDLLRFSLIFQTLTHTHGLYFAYTGLISHSCFQSKTFPLDPLELNISHQQNFLHSTWIFLHKLPSLNPEGTTFSWVVAALSPSVVVLTWTLPIWLMQLFEFSKPAPGAGCGWRKTHLCVDGFTWIQTTNFLWPKQGHILPWSVHLPTLLGNCYIPAPSGFG